MKMRARTKKTSKIASRMPASALPTSRPRAPRSSRTSAPDGPASPALTSIPLFDLRDHTLKDELPPWSPSTLYTREPHRRFPAGAVGALPPEESQGSALERQIADDLCRVVQVLTRIVCIGMA